MHLVPGEAVGVEAHEAGALHGGAAERRDEEEEVGVVPGSMGHVLGEMPAMAYGEIPDDERRASPLSHHGLRGALEGRDETRRRPVSIVSAKPPDPQRVARELGPVGEHATVRHSDRAVNPGRERRRGARASAERGEGRGERDERDERASGVSRGGWASYGASLLPFFVPRSRDERDFAWRLWRIDRGERYLLRSFVSPRY